MDNVNFKSTMKQDFKGGRIDYSSQNLKKPTPPEIMSQTRRPKAISKTQAHFDEKMGKGYDFIKEPYPNYLGSK